MSLFDILQNRFSCRKFISDKAIPKDDINRLISVASLSPSAINLRPWKFFVYQSAQNKELISNIAYNQPHIKDCSCVIVLCSRSDVRAKDEYVINLFKDDPKRDMAMKFLNIKDEKFSDADIRNFVDNQCYIVATNLINLAYDMGISSCIIGGFEKDKMKEFMQVDDKFNPVLLIALGYSDGKPHSKSMQKIDEILTFKD